VITLLIGNGCAGDGAEMEEQMRSTARFLVGLGLVATGLVLPATQALATTSGTAAAAPAQSGVTLLPTQPPAFACGPSTDGWITKSTGNDYYECKPDIGDPDVWKWHRLP
jgi:hypothetical protein